MKMGRKLALSVGINDFPSSPLRGCINDSNMVSKLLKDKFGYDVVQLLNEQATRLSIVSFIKSMAIKSEPGDSFVIHASSHGTQVRDRNNEELDGLDEALVCYFEQGQDFMDHLLIDDDFSDLISKFNQESNITFLMDCCHSGTSTRAAFFAGDVVSRFIKPPNGRDAVPAKYYNKNTLSYACSRVCNLFRSTPKKNKLINGDIMGVVLSACKDNQTAADAFIDGSYCGAFSKNLVKAVNESRTLRVDDVFKAMVTNVKSKFKQDPQLKTNKPEKLKSQIFA
jgi:hypothetical protein